MASPPCAASCGCSAPTSPWSSCHTGDMWISWAGERGGIKSRQHAHTRRRSMFLTRSVVNAQTFVKRIADRVCHVCITRHWFFCRGLALQPFILCFAVGPNGFEKFCYSPVTPEANVRIDFTCAGPRHLSRARAVRAKAKWKAIHTKLLRQSHRAVPCRRHRRRAGWNTACNNAPAIINTNCFATKMPVRVCVCV